MRRAAVLSLVGGAALLVAAGAATWLLTREPGPDAAAEEFLAALSDGDGSAAAELLADGVPTDDLADAYAGAAEYVTEERVTAVESFADGRVEASFSFVLDGRERTGVFTLLATDGGWRVDADALGELTATTSIGDAILIGGTRSSSGSFERLLPAVYDVGPAPQEVLSGSQPVIVLPGATASADIEATLSPEAGALAQEQLDAYAEACAAATDAIPDDCGIRIPWAADLADFESVTFRIETYPTLLIDEDATGFQATDGVLVASVTGTTSAGDRTTRTYRTESWALRGDVSFSGGQMLLSVR